MHGDTPMTAALVGGLVLTVSFLLGPAVSPTWYARALHGWGAKRQVRVEFVLDERRRLREGPRVETALGRLYVRQTVTVFVGLACLGASGLLLNHGPHLSTSTANSLAVAGLPVLASVMAALQLREFLAPYRTEGGSARPVAPEDYLWPGTRAVVWLVAGAGLLVPLLALVLAAGSTYDGGRIWWEGVAGLPLAGVALVVVAERGLHALTDEAAGDDPTLYVWDCLRTRAAQLLLGFGLVDLVLAFDAARTGLGGVALTGAAPGWLGAASVTCWLLQLLSSCGVLLLLAQPLGPRLRERLWPGVPREERIEFGRALPIP